ncbi:MAG: protein translocase subunit SecD [Marmoricola sp.]
MASRTARPGRTLLIFLVVVAFLYALAAIGGSWKPRLGLDLAGGTTITLVPQGNPQSGQLDQAAKIIRQRVNGNGVTEATVATQGSQIVVSIPGKLSQNLVDSVSRQAQLRFRILASCGSNPCEASGLPAKPTPSKSPTASPTAKPTTSPTATPTKAPSKTPTAKATATKLPRPAYEFGKKATPSPSPTLPLTVPSSSPTPSNSDTTAKDSVALAWAKTPPQVWEALFLSSKCLPRSPGVALVPAIANTLTATPTLSTAQLTKALSDKSNTKLVEAVDDGARPLIACDTSGNKYLLSAATIEGHDVTSASAGIGQSSISWQVNLGFNDHGANVFADLSRAMVTGGGSTYSGMQFAIVLDGTLLSAPTFNGVITGGNAQITGNFTQDTATSLATSLNFGSLPVRFKPNPTVNAVGATLAGSQLTAGIVAGVVGLLIVMVYCLLYYRGLGLVVVASLMIAALVSYVIVLLLGKSAGFTLSLPGIAGLIVAVGITADSFIVYFERIRDEMRDGKSMRLAVQAGWVRARNTCLAADTVSLLAAVALYLFAIDVIRGFAFALGISTLIDLAVFFWFTHPVISLLSRKRFFNSGHRLSGLSPETLGIERRRLVGKVGA